MKPTESSYCRLVSFATRRLHALFGKSLTLDARSRAVRISGRLSKTGPRSWFRPSLRRIGRTLGIPVGAEADGSLTVELSRDAEGSQLLAFCHFLNHAVRRHRLEMELTETNAGIIALWNDVDDQRRRAEAATQTIEELNRSKDRFLAVLAHELRTPLAAILLAAEELRIEEGLEELTGLQVIHRQGRQLKRLVDDLLEATRATRHKLKLNRTVHPLSRSLEAALRMTGPKAAAKNLRLMRPPPPSDVFVDGDEDRLVQVWSNLLDNAVKYSEPGGAVEVSVQTEPEQVRVQVRDEGRGFDEDASERIFAAFVQEREVFESSETGLGLGLALVDELVRLHGGQASASSPGAGRGATLTVELPRVARPSPSVSGPGGASGTDPNSSRSLSVLIAEDDEDLRTLVARAFRRREVQVTEAATGPEALDRARQSDFDAMIFDLGLPGMGGLSLAEEVRRLGTAAVLIAATGHGSEEALRRTREAGFDHHLVKPLDIEKVLDLISKREDHAR